MISDLKLRPKLIIGIDKSEKLLNNNKSQISVLLLYAAQEKALILYLFKLLISIVLNTLDKIYLRALILLYLQA